MANLIRTNPFRDLMAIRDDFARLFGAAQLADQGETLNAGWVPAVDIYEDAEGITVKAEIAGMEAKDIDVKIADGVLTMTGERKLEQSDKKDNYTRIERYHGTFTRCFTLPPTVDAEKVRAEARNGMLRIFLPKKETAKPKQVSVKVT